MTTLLIHAITVVIMLTMFSFLIYKIIQINNIIQRVSATIDVYGEEIQKLDKNLSISAKLALEVKQSTKKHEEIKRAIQRIEYDALKLLSKYSHFPQCLVDVCVEGIAEAIYIFKGIYVDDNISEANILIKTQSIIKKLKVADYCKDASELNIYKERDQAHLSERLNNKLTILCYKIRDDLVEFKKGNYNGTAPDLFRIVCNDIFLMVFNVIDDSYRNRNN